ncbi:MAG: response regulator transcription factor [Ruminococcaceae bacterium]|nr:response regulator transcription factor [Oscillospiraceae bacterium]
MARILIVEDEYPINNLISKNLTLTGHECMSAYDGLNAIELIQSAKLDLIILDVMLPGLSGFDLIKLIGDIPVIFVTAKSGLEDRLKGLSLGADDYIVKPFAMQELLARVSIVLRRTKRDDNTISFDGLTVDMGSRKVYRGDEKINLTPKEYALLEVLITHRNLALSREKLISMVWTYDYEGDTRTVDVHIQQLRQKLGLKDRIKTIYKVGYRLEL